MVSWVSLTGLLLVAIVLLCSEPGGALARRRNQAKGSEVANGIGGGVGRRRKHNSRGKKARKGKKGQKGKKARKGKKGKKGKKTRKEKKGKKTEANKEVRKTDSVKNMGKFKHCDYIDLVEVGYREGSNCAPGGKFIFKAAPGIRRQFLMTKETNIALFLTRGEKFASCNDVFNDITASVKCKAMDGVMKMGITMKTGGASCAQCPDKQPVAPAAVMTGSTDTVLCKCPEVRNFICTTEIESTANGHTITCNKNAVHTIACGTDLKGTKKLLAGLLSVDKYKHKLCSTKQYTAILADYEWRCQDPSVPLAASPACAGDPTVATTEAVTNLAGTTV